MLRILPKCASPQPTATKIPRKGFLKSSHSRSKNKVSQRRLKQLKFLLMLGMIRMYNKEYILRVNYNDLCTSTLQANLWEMTYFGFRQLQEQVTNQIKRLKESFKSEANEEEQDIRFTIIGKQNSMFKSLNLSKESLRQLKLKKQRSEYKYRYEQEVNYFEKLNLVIDKADKKTLIRKSFQHLNILKEIILNIKTIIYKYYKEIKTLDEDKNQRIANLKFYCNIIFQIFKEVYSLIVQIIEKDESFIKFEKYFKKYEPKGNKNDSIDQYFQTTLFYFTSILELKRLYEICPRLLYIAEQRNDLICRLVRNVIRFRHIMGYLSKEIINVSLQSRDKSMFKNKNEEKQIWKKIYDKKYVSNQNKHALRLE